MSFGKYDKSVGSNYDKDGTCSTHLRGEKGEEEVEEVDEEVDNRDSS